MLHTLKQKIPRSMRELAFRTKSQMTYLLSRPYYVPYYSWFVWYYILNRHSRKLYEKHPARLNTVQKRITSELKENGIAITHVDEFFGDKQLLRELNAYAKQLLPTAHTNEKKPYLKRMFDKHFLIETQNPFVGVTLNQKVLESISAYMGMWCDFWHYGLDMTMPMEQGAPRGHAQRWHRDPFDKKSCKMFLYLNDIDETAGPFNYVVGSHYGGVRRHVLRARPPLGYYPKVGEVEKKVPKEAVRVCTGKAGTIIFCDTGGLHRGGYATKKERIMFTAAYTSRSLVKRAGKKAYELSADFKIDSLSPLARYALTTKDF